MIVCVYILLNFCIPTVLCLNFQNLPCLHVPYHVVFVLVISSQVPCNRLKRGKRLALLECLEGPTCL